MAWQPVDGIWQQFGGRCGSSVEQMGEPAWALLTRLRRYQAPNAALSLTGKPPHGPRTSCTCAARATTPAGREPCSPTLPIQRALSATLHSRYPYCSRTKTTPTSTPRTAATAAATAVATAVPRAFRRRHTTRLARRLLAGSSSNITTSLGHNTPSIISSSTQLHRQHHLPPTPSSRLANCTRPAAIPRFTLRIPAHWRL